MADREISGDRIICSDTCGLGGGGEFLEPFGDHFSQERITIFEVPVRRRRTDARLLRRAA